MRWMWWLLRLTTLIDFTLGSRVFEMRQRRRVIHTLRIKAMLMAAIGASLSNTANADAWDQINGETRRRTDQVQFIFSKGKDKYIPSINFEKRHFDFIVAECKLEVPSGLT